MRAALYLRRSTIDLQPDSLAAQEERLVARAAEDRNDIVRQYADSRSGRTAKRPAFQRLISDVQHHPDFDLIYVLDVSRWGRFENADEAAYWEFFCLLHGVRVVYVDEQFQTAPESPYAALLKTLRRVTASEFSRDKSRYVAGAIERCTRLGFRHGGRPPYGMRNALYTRDGKYVKTLALGERKFSHLHVVKLVPGPAREVETVRRVFRMYADQHQSPDKIARILNDENVPTMLGAMWSAKQIWLMLHHVAYIGTALSVSAVRRDQDGYPHRTETPGAWAGIVPHALWTRARAEDTRRSKKKDDAELAAELREAFEVVGAVPRTNLKDWPANISHWHTYRKRFPRGRFGALEVAYTNEISRALTKLKNELSHSFEIEEQVEQWLVNGVAGISFKFSFPEYWRGSLRWQFRFDGSESGEIILCLGFSVPPNVEHIATFTRYKRTTPAPFVWYPRVVGEVARVKATSSTVARRIRLHMYAYSERAESAFIDACRSKTMITFKEIAKTLHWSKGVVAAMYYRLKARGVFLPPKTHDARRWVVRVCARCGLQKRIRTSAFAKLKSDLCFACYSTNPREPRFDVTCPDCGAVRKLEASRVRRLRDGLNSRCRGCHLRLLSQRNVEHPTRPRIYRYPVRCEQCGKIRMLREREIRQRKTKSCAACSRFKATAKVLTVACPDCGARRRYPDYEVGRLSHGIRTRCKSCTARNARTAAKPAPTLTRR